MLDTSRGLRGRSIGSTPHQRGLVAWLGRRKRLSALVPVVVLVLGTPHSCPLC